MDIFDLELIEFQRSKPRARDRRSHMQRRRILCPVRVCRPSDKPKKRTSPKASFGKSDSLKIPTAALFEDLRDNTVQQAREKRGEEERAREKA